MPLLHYIQHKPRQAFLAESVNLSTFISHLLFGVFVYLVFPSIMEIFVMNKFFYQLVKLKL